MFSLSVDVDGGGGGPTPSARVISPRANGQPDAKDAAAFAARSIRLVCVMALVGALVAVLPLSLTAFEGGRQLQTAALPEGASQDASAA